MTATNDPDFLGSPEDEALAGKVYDAFPRFEAGNLVNRRECVHLIAEAMRAAYKDKAILESKLSVAKDILEVIAKDKEFSCTLAIGCLKALEAYKEKL